jgi:hypothetical protein
MQILCSLKSAIYPGLKNRRTTTTQRYKNAWNSRTQPLAFTAVGTLIHKGYCSPHLAVAGHTTIDSCVAFKFPELLGGPTYTWGWSCSSKAKTCTNTETVSECGSTATATQLLKCYESCTAKTKNKHYMTNQCNRMFKYNIMLLEAPQLGWTLTDHVLHTTSKFWFIQSVYQHTTLMIQQNYYFQNWQRCQL